MRRLTLLTALLVSAAACGDDENVLPSIDGSTADAAPAIDALDGPGPVMPTALFVAGNLSTTGILSRINVANRTVEPNALAGVAGGEPWIRHIGSEFFIVNRADGNNVTIVGGSPLALVDQFSTGAGTNPQDVAVVGNKLYVPAYGTAGVVVINRTTRANTTIDLQAAAMDTDGMPECASAYAVGNRVFVTCQRLDRSGTFWVPRGVGRVVVIDATTDTVVGQGFNLINANPTGRLVATPSSSLYGGDLLVSTTPNFGDYSTGCLERIGTGTTPESHPCAVQNVAMSGSATAVEVSAAGDKIWLLVQHYQSSAPFGENGHLRSLDLTTGNVSAAFTPDTGSLRDAAACPGGYLLATDGTTGAAGLRIWRDGTETTTTPLALGREPAFSYGLVCF